MKNRFDKIKFNNKSSNLSNKNKSENIKKIINIRTTKKIKKRINYFSVPVKLLFLTIFISIYYFCKNYSAKLLKYYYKTRIKYLKKFRKKYNESNLVTLSEKLNWIAIHDVKKLKGKCADKILLHEYSRQVLKKDICNKILKIYDDPYKINISELPDQFVLKTNHGSGYNIIVHNKSELNIEKAKRQLNDWLQIDYSKVGAEFHYTFIKRKVFAEEYIGKSLNNYKFMCYNGIPRFIYIAKTENGQKYRNFFDINWNPLDFNCDYPPHPTEVYSKPDNYDLMIKIVRKLAKPFKLVRVDLYEHNNEVRLGELTFTPFDSIISCKNPQHEIELAKDLKLF